MAEKTPDRKGIWTLQRSLWLFTGRRAETVFTHLLRCIDLSNLRFSFIERLVSVFALAF